MSFYKTYKSSNGSLTTFNFNLGDLVIINIGNILVTIIIVTSFSILLPLIFLWIYWTTDETMPNNGKVASGIAGLIFSIYLVLDYHYGLVTWSLMGHVIPNFFTAMAHVWLTLAFFFFFATFFGKLIYNFLLRIDRSISEGGADRIIKLIFIFLLVLFFKLASILLMNIHHYDGISSIFKRMQ